MKNLSSGGNPGTRDALVQSPPVNTALKSSDWNSSTTKSTGKGKSQVTTPLRGVRGKSEPPAAVIKKKPSSSSKALSSSRASPSPSSRKRHPAQQLTAGIPQDFKQTKVCISFIFFCTDLYVGQALIQHFFPF
jgi:hypothetical protein